MAVQLREHQKLAVEELDNGKILAGGVGSGKSVVALSYYMKHEAPKDIVVITTAKKRDSLEWEGEAVKYGIGREFDATTQGMITVDSWNNIQKYVGVEGAFFIFDEQRLVGSGAWAKAFIKISRLNRWILLSATPGDTWMDYIPVFVANGFYRNKTEFITRHVVYDNFAKFPKVKKYVETARLELYLEQILVTMPYEKQTVRNIQKIRVEHDQDKFNRVMKDRWNVYEDRPIVDVAELFRVMRKVVNEDPDRLKQIIHLFKKHKQLIIF